MKFVMLAAAALGLTIATLGTPADAAGMAQIAPGFDKAPASRVDQVHWRRWSHCHGRGHWRRCHGGYASGPRYYGYYGYSRPGVVLRFGGHRHRGWHGRHWR